MRVVQVSDVFLPRVGGIEMQVHDLAREQIRAGDRVRVLTLTPGEHGDGLDIRHPERPWWRRRPAGEHLAGADVVHCHSSIVSPLSWAAARQATRQGLPVVVTVHSMITPTATVGRGFAGVVRALGPAVVWTAVSRAAAAILQPFVRTPVTVLPNGIEPGVWRRPTAGSPQGPGRTIVTVMRLAPRKRPLPTVDILADIRARMDPTVPLRAVIIGDGPQRSAVAAQLRARRMTDWVQLTGRLSRDAIAEQLAVSDLYLAPAHHESFGIAALEARCAGVPVAAMAGGGVTDFIHDGVEGLITPSDADMGRRSAELLQNAVVLERMRRHNLTVPTGLDWAGSLARTTAVYQDAAQRCNQIHSDELVRIDS